MALEPEQIVDGGWPILQGQRGTLGNLGNGSGRAHRCIVASLQCNAVHCTALHRVALQCKPIKVCAMMQRCNDRLTLRGDPARKSDQKQSFEGCSTAATLKQLSCCGEGVLEIGALRRGCKLAGTCVGGLQENATKEPVKATLRAAGKPSSIRPPRSWAPPGEATSSPSCTGRTRE